MQDHSPLQPSEEQPEDSSSSQENEKEAQLSQTPTHQDGSKSLRAELEAGSHQEIEEVSTMPEDMAREVTELRQEVARTQRQMAALSSQLSFTQELPIVQRKRGGCLSAWLVFVGISNVLLFIFGLVSISTPGSLSLLYLLSGVIALVGAVGIWQLKKWGYYTLMACYVAALVFSLLPLGTGSFGQSASPSVGTIIGMIITSVLVLKGWEAFE
jgi:hypothetical protein